jgi:hypothetical protein
MVRLSGSCQLPLDIALGGTRVVETGVLGQQTFTLCATDLLGGPPLRRTRR